MHDDRASERSRRTVLAGLAAGASAAAAGCLGGGDGFESDEEDDVAPPDDDGVEVDPVEEPEEPPVGNERGFGEPWEVPGTPLTVTLATPSIAGQVARTSAPRGHTYASVAITIANDGDERGSVDPDAFHAIVREEWYDHDNKPQGALISGIAEPGTTVEKQLYFAVPAETRRDAVAVRYADAVEWVPE